MSGWMSYFTGTRDTKKPAREAIIKLRQNLQLLEKKGDHLQKQIDEQHNIARTNAVGNQDGMWLMCVARYGELLTDITISGKSGVEAEEGASARV